MEEKYWVWLAKLEHVRNKTKQKLLEKYENPRNIWNLEKGQIATIDKIAKEEIEEISNKTYKEGLGKHLDYMDKNNIRSITIKQEAYPPNLKQIYDPPIVLFIKGEESILKEFSLGIVGCRNCSEYGKKTAQKIAFYLAKRNINIVSGLAKGIDSNAHLGCLQAKGKTIAVLGNGIDQIYPQENKKLYEQIVDNGGALVCEYVVGSKPIKQHFPARNRIISGLSNGIIVVEARAKSGSFITVDFALEQGKEIFAVPGNITNVTSIGTNDLIKQGAKIVTTVEDILNEYIN